MNITKSGLTAASGELSAEDLELINSYARKTLSAEEVYTFALLLCDNEIDRDGERFDEGTLRQLAEMFSGKTGISDHEWKSGNQVARIYRAEYVEQPGRKTADGRAYGCVKAWAYMLRTEENAPLIAQIDGGIKRETSVGCAVRENICSICGRDYGSGDCAHIKGREYGGKICHVILSGAVDAYEWSFVAVPAQPAAGVVKAVDCSGGLKGFVNSSLGKNFAPELEKLEEYSRLGRLYLQELRAEVKRLGLICDRQIYKNMDCAIEQMDAESLREMKLALEAKAAEKLPIVTQLPGLGEVTRFDGGEYNI